MSWRCHQLDGMPLAIELAAARVKTLTVEQISARLDDRFRLLAGDFRTALPRHRTLRAAMDWSHDLLSEKERILLRRLSVFAGGWTLGAAEAVCAGDEIDARETLDLLSRLVDQSLVVAEARDGACRYRLLETVRQYAQDRLLASEDIDAVPRRHRDWYLCLAQRADPELRGPLQALCLRCLEVEHDNLRVALDWSATRSEEADTALRLAGHLSWFWFTSGHIGEGRARLEAALRRESAASDRARQSPVRCRLLAWRQDAYDRAGPLLRQSLTLFRRMEDAWGSGLACHFLGHIAETEGDAVRAGGLFDR